MMTEVELELGDTEPFSIKQKVMVFVEDCLEQFEGVPEWSEVAALFNNIQKNREAKESEFTHLLTIASKVYKDYKKNSPERIFENISKEIPLDKAIYKRLPVEPCGISGDDLTVGDYIVSIRRAQGKRACMEDEDVAALIRIESKEGSVDIPYFAVFDGHGGLDCSAFLKKEFTKFLQRAFRGVDLFDIVAVDEAFKTSFIEANAFYHEADKVAGSTGIVAFITPDGYIWIANAGDSRAVVSIQGKAFQLSLDAKPSNEKFRKGVLNRGGKVLGNRVGGALAVARAFGDKYVPGITARPLIKRFSLNSNKSSSNHLILASDGLFDVVGSEDAASLVVDRTATFAADALIKEAFKRGTKDNVTVLVVDLTLFSL